MGASLSNGPSDDDDLPPMAEINVTPFVDVMLVLLIIFMVTAPLMLAGVPVKLPQTAAARQNPPQKPLVISMTADGALHIRTDAVPPAELVSRLAELRTAEGDSIAYVRADKSIPYGQVMEVLGNVASAGYERVSLLSERTPGSTAGQ
jgi:biopolymer transport protein TolR